MIVNHHTIQQLRRATEDAADNNEKVVVPPDTMHSVLDVISRALAYTDLMDGGITAALIEQEAQR